MNSIISYDYSLLSLSATSKMCFRIRLGIQGTAHRHWFAFNAIVSIEGVLSKNE